MAVRITPTGGQSFSPVEQIKARFGGGGGSSEGNTSGSARNRRIRAEQAAAEIRGRAEIKARQEKARQEKIRQEKERKVKVKAAAERRTARATQEKARVRRVTVSKSRNQARAYNLRSSQTIRDRNTGQEISRGRNIREAQSNREAQRQAKFKSEFSAAKQERLQQEKGGTVRTSKGSGKMSLSRAEAKKDLFGRVDNREQGTASRVGTVELVENKPFFSLGGARERVTNKAEQLRIERSRGDRTIKGEVQSFGIGAASNFLGGAEFVKQLYTQPKETIKSTGKGALSIVTGKARFPEVSKILRTDPSYATGFIAAEIGTDVIIGKAATKLGNIADITATRFSSKFVPLDNDILKLKTVAGDDLIVKTTPKILDESLKTQANVIGKRVDAVSGGQDFFTRGIDEVTINKKLPKGTPELEKGFFADPRGKLRTSRIGVKDVDTASFADVLSGDVKFGRPKPQAIIFPDTKVSKLPKGIQSSLDAGKTLTTKQTKALQKFQLTPTGEFKPIGYLSKEPEILLAPGEIVRKRGLIGETIINNKRVTLFEAEVKTSKVGKATAKFTSDINLPKGSVSNKPFGITSSSIRDTKFIPIETVTSPLAFSSKNIISSSSKPPVISYSKIVSTPPISLYGSSKGSSGNNINKSFIPYSFSPSSRGGSSGGRPSPISPIRSVSSPIYPTKSIYPISPVKTYPRRNPRSPILNRPIRRPLAREPVFMPPRRRSYPGSKPRQRQGRHSVYLRRFGKFKLVGVGRTKEEALLIGKRKASTTLGATFKVTGIGNVKRKVAGFRTKRTKKGEIEFIEMPKFRLSKSSETKEINFFRRRSTGRKRRRR